jgi:hypothetical protein
MSIEGVELKNLFPQAQQLNLLRAIGYWFEKNKTNFAAHSWGEELYIDFDRVYQNLESVPLTNVHFFGAELAPELLQLCNAIVSDSATDPELSDRNIRFLFKRTGEASHDNEYFYHTDTDHIYWDKDGNRIGYDSVRARPKYLVYVNRPGTLIIHGKIDPALTWHESVEKAALYSLDKEGLTHSTSDRPEPIVFQLLPNSIYKIAVGDLIHCPPPHADGLLIAAIFNR